MKTLIFSTTLCFVSILSSLFAQTTTGVIYNRDSIVVKTYFNDIKVYKGEFHFEELQNKTPILGNIKKNDSSLVFLPLVPFGWNQVYTISYNTTTDHFLLELPKNYKHLSVEAIYPSASILPSNILKWHIQFSRPINKTNVYEHIQFVDNYGEEISKAILPIENTLTNSKGTLLTLWIEPGRQKRDLIPNQQLGPVFVSGNDYKIIINKELKDQNGVPMLQTSAHKFTIADADRDLINISSWEVLPPVLKTKSSLIINCHESLDYTSALNGVFVIYNNKKVAGNWEIKDNETKLIFNPLKIWNKGNYIILFNSKIEDLSGNNLNRLFDHKIENNINNSEPKKEFKLEFNIR